jgi:PIN domain nuclease of toxin-antitoxin system
VIVLDTHVLIWALSERDHLSEAADRLFERSAREKSVHVSSISVWEIALLHKRGRLKFSMDLESWITHVESVPFIKFIPVNNNIATRSVELPDPFYNDPADRIIVATALYLGATLLTKDQQILDYPHVASLW